MFHEGCDLAFFVETLTVFVGSSAVMTMNYLGFFNPRFS